jgi:RNA polymerase sigma-32 factor
MSTALQCMNNNALTVANLASYKHWVNQIPLLTDEEELSLSKKLYDNDDVEAARRLVMSHLRFVVKVARGYNGYGLAQEDLIQEGNIGLMKAVKRFNPMVGVRLVSFAVYWVRAEIHEFVIRNWRIVKIATTKAQRKLFFKLRQACKSIGTNFNTRISNDEAKIIGEELNVKPETVQQMQTRLSSFDQSFDPQDSQDTQDNYHESNAATAPALYLEDNSYSPEMAAEETQWEQKQKNKLYQAMKKLDERSQIIIQERWLKQEEKKSTLHQLAERFSISAERIRQLEKQAMDKLQLYLIPSVT